MPDFDTWINTPAPTSGGPSSDTPSSDTSSSDAPSSDTPPSGSSPSCGPSGARAEKGALADGPRPDIAAVHRRVVRRETHVSRTAAVSVVMVLVVPAMVLVAAAAAFVLVDRPLFGFDARSVIDAARIAPHGLVPPIVVPVGAVVAIIGLCLVLLGVLPARRARHTMSSGRLAIVIDDEVIASAAARAARSATRLGPDASVGTVGRRTVDVVLRPAAGVDVPVMAATEAVRAEISAIDCSPPVEPRIRVQPTGRVDG